METFLAAVTYDRIIEAAELVLILVMLHNMRRSSASSLLAAHQALQKEVNQVKGRVNRLDEVTAGHTFQIGGHSAEIIHLNAAQVGVRADVEILRTHIKRFHPEAVDP